MSALEEDEPIRGKGKKPAKSKKGAEAERDRALQAAGEELVPMEIPEPGEVAEGGSRDRKAFIVECDLSPGSLCGSWFIQPDGWGIVVGEPQPGHYLVQYEQLGETYQQKLVHLGEMEGWLFYDTEETMRAAFAEAEREEVNDHG